MIRTMLMSGVLLVVAPAPASAQDAPPVAAKQSSASIDRARALAREGRTDEAVAGLLRLTTEPALADEAARALRAILLTATPRRAWAPAYAATLVGAPNDQRHALKVQAARADFQDAGTRDSALRQLQALLGNQPDDEELRLTTAEALLETGQFDAALGTLGSRDSGPIRRVRVAALVALDQLDNARKVDEVIIPTSCRTARTRTACAAGLEEMGYRGAAAASLRVALRKGHSDLRTRGAQAGAWARIGAIEEDRGEIVLAMAAWRNAQNLLPDNRIYKDRLTNLLATTGRTDEAAELVGDSDPQLKSTIEAVRLVNSVDPGESSVIVDAAIEQAQLLDATHPLVVQANAHWLIARNRPKEALRLLTPYIDSRLNNPAFLDLYVWAASSTDDAAQAAEVVEAALKRADDPRRWRRRSSQLANLFTLAAEQAKDRGDFEDAEALYGRARGADPLSVRVLVGLGGVLWKRNKTKQAISVYREALDQAPGNRVALFSLVELLRLEGRETAARYLLLESGYDDLKVRSLEAELAVMAEAREATRLRDAGRLDESLAAFASLVEAHPDQPALLHAYADALSEDGRLVAAAETYARARVLDPNNPWLVMGEITALISLQQPEEARRLLARLPADSNDEALGNAIRKARWGIERVEAERLITEGRADAALKLLQDWIADAEDADAGVAIGNLYQSRWQHDAAAAWYGWALELDPGLEDAEHGLVRADMGRGRMDAAEKRAADLVRRDASVRNVALARSVSRRRALERAIAAAAEGDHAVAERIVLDQIAQHPDDLNLLTAHARLLLLRGEPRAALREAQGVLAVDPTHDDALSTVQAAALDFGEADLALEAYEIAVAAGAAGWVRDSIHTLRLATRLDRARVAYANGPRESADSIVEQAAKFYGDNDARRWSLIGGAWLDISRPGNARAAFELARREAPDDPGATVGLASAWETLGQPARAESTLAAHWLKHRHPTVGVALVELQRRRGRTDAAKKTLSQLRESANNGDLVVTSDAPPPDALPEVAPQGRTIDDSGAYRSPDSPSWDVVDLSGLSADESRTPVTVTLGSGWVGRPGNAGEQFLDVLYVPLAVEADLPGLVDIQAEIVGVQLSDGAREIVGSSMSAALTTALPGPWRAKARIGRDTVATDGFQPMNTWFLSADGRVTGGLVAEIQAGKSPVTDSLTSWAGNYSDDGVPFGRVYDTWAGAGFSHGWPDGSIMGALGRVGHADENAENGAMGQVPWRQLLAYGRTPIQVNGRRTTYAGFEVILLDHDRQVDGFEPGLGGMFTPDSFATGIARIEMVVAPEGGRWTACGLAGAGPQVVQGEQTLYLFPGTYLAYQMQGTAQAELGRNFWLMGHAMHAGTFGAWSQSAVFAQLRFGAPTRLSSPSPILGSLIHGPPLSQPDGCAEPSTEVGQ